MKHRTLIFHFKKNCSFIEHFNDLFKPDTNSKFALHN